VRRLGVVGNPRYPGLAAVLRRIVRRAPDLGFTPAFEPEVRDLVDGGELLGSPDGLDVLVTLGGDGTMLRGARFLAGARVPILGINLGRLGFLSCCGVERLEEALEEMAAGRRVIESRMMLVGCTGRASAGGGIPARWLALNDIVLHKIGFARVVQLRVSVDGEPIAAFQADGLIVSTPTGSTAYSLSAGGPVVEPGVESILLTPISPHTLALRPVVLPPAARVVVRSEGTTGELAVTVDGQVGATVAPGDELVVQRAPMPALIVRLPDSTFFSRMRWKLGWGGLPERDEVPSSDPC
jgi:NAD+ kinase